MTESNSNKQSMEFARSDQELIGSARKRRQLLMLVGLFVLAVLVIGAIVLAVYLVTGDDHVEEDPREAIDLGDILNGTFSVRRFNGTWIDDSSYQFWDSSGNLLAYNVKEKTSKIAIFVNQTELTQASSHEFSFDQRYILIASQILKLFRHSSLAFWDIYDTETKRVIPINFNKQRTALQFAKFSPADNSLVFVHDNNIYYKKSPVDDEIKITKDGSLKGGVFNGVPDWVYEEEIFSSNSALWFSPDGKKLAFMRFDDREVRSMNLPIYGGPGDPFYQYPQNLMVFYPKAASKNPEVNLFAIDLSTVTDETSAENAIKLVPVPTRFVNNYTDHIIASVSWANDDNVVAVYMNRVQNQADIRKCTVGSGNLDCKDVKDLDVSGGWVEFYTAPFYNKDGSEIIFINSEGGYQHVVSVNLNNGERVARTTGKFIVDQILGVSKKSNLIYFTANTEEDVKVRHVYVIKNELGATKSCLTCNKETHFGKHSYFDAEISTDGSHIIVSAEGPEIPKHSLASVDHEKLEVTDIIDLELNEKLSSTVHGKKFPNVIYDSVKLDGGSTSYAKLVLPTDYDPTMKYPMIVDVYGGPNSVSVTTRWSVDWGTYLVSAKNYIYVRIDGRGSGNKGDENLFTLYRKLGTVEVNDQIETAKKLQEKYKFINERKSAIWGWSYGGYVSGMSLAKDTEDVFKCGVSVAPVTDWTLYDSIYTERYMGLPTKGDNFQGYEDAQLMKYVDNFKTHNKTYMLVHGTLDDNVHFQQGMMLARALETKDIMFQEITYPDEDHSLGRVRPHLYHTLEHFFAECFQS